MSPAGRFRAVIFDLDGVLWDGEPLYHEAFNVVLAPLGHHVSEDDYNQVIGQSVEACWDWMWERFKLADPAASFLPAYDRAVLQLLERPAEPLPGVRSLISELKRLGVPPERCLAVEDTLAGVRSAKAAGMFVVQLRAASTALPPLDEADLVLDDLSQFDVSVLAPAVPEVQS